MKVVVLFLAIFAVPIVLGEDPWVPTPSYWNSNFTLLFEAHLNTTRTLGENIKVIFYGDSITEWWANDGKSVWEETYAPLQAVNYGIGADRTQNVLWRIINGEIGGLNPKLVVLKIGTNNLGLGSAAPWMPPGDTVSDTARGVMTVVRELRVRLPATKILLIGILPCVNTELTESREQVNEYLALLDNGIDIRFLNMTDSFYKGDGQFYTDLYTEDVAHLSEAGYWKWNETMWGLFQEMLNSDSANSSGLLNSTHIVWTMLITLLFFNQSGMK